MRKIITTILFIFILSLSVFAQTDREKEEPNCPDLWINGPPSSVASGDIMTFTMRLSEDYDDDKIIITWSVEKGSIIKGQGTKTISVKQPDDEAITATVNVVIGSCNLSGSETGIPFDPPIPVLIDEFGYINKEDIQARMDAFIIDLQNNPDSQGYIINYGTRKEISKREKLIRNLFSEGGIRCVPRSLIFVNGGNEKELLTRFWRVPAGADTSKIN